MAIFLELYKLSKRKHVAEREFIDPLTYALYQKITKTAGAEKGLKGYFNNPHLLKLAFLLENTSIFLYSIKYIELEEDGEEWSEFMWKYITYGIPQTLKLPSFDILSKLCDPKKIIEKEKISEKVEANPGEKIDIMKMFSTGKYKELVKLLLIDETAAKEFAKNLENLGIQPYKYPSFMSSEDKLNHIKSLLKEPIIKLEESKQNSEKTEILQNDPNDLELE